MVYAIYVFWEKIEFPSPSFAVAELHIVTVVDRFWEDMGFNKLFGGGHTTQRMTEGQSIWPKRLAEGFGSSFWPKHLAEAFGQSI